MSLYREYNVKTRNEIIRAANEMIKKVRETGREYTIVFGEKDSIKYIKSWENRKYKPKQTPKDTNKAIVNWLKEKLDLGKPIE